MKSKIEIESRQPAGVSNAAQAIARGDVTEQPAHAESGQCAAIKTDGETCHANTMVGSPWCYFHDPETAEERIAASRRGGQKNSPATLPHDTPDFPLATAADASALIGRTINQLLRGDVDSKIANAVGYLVTIKIKVTDTEALERRVAALEAALHNDHSDAKNGGGL